MVVATSFLATVSLANSTFVHVPEARDKFAKQSLFAIWVVMLKTRGAKDLRKDQTVFFYCEHLYECCQDNH
jgi:hypothetical protein